MSITYDSGGRAYEDGPCSRSNCEINPCSGHCKIRRPEHDRLQSNVNPRPTYAAPPVPPPPPRSPLAQLGPCRFPACQFINCPKTGCYAAPAPVAQPSQAVATPALPEATLEDHEYELWGQNARADFYTADQMRTYGAACASAAPAPVAQGEPVAWLVLMHHWKPNADGSAHHEIKTANEFNAVPFDLEFKAPEDHYDVEIPLYAAPAPVAQSPGMREALQQARDLLAMAGDCGHFARKALRVMDAALGIADKKGGSNG